MKSNKVMPQKIYNVYQLKRSNDFPMPTTDTIRKKINDFNPFLTKPREKN